MSKEGVNGVLNQACASCKHQRKKCDESCELAPYFPATRFREFQNAHRLFGVSNIQKILASVEPQKRNSAAESILMEANLRRDDPVHGCLGVCRSLASQIEFYQNQLNIANNHLALLRGQSQKLDNFDQFLPNMDGNDYMGDTSNLQRDGYIYRSTLEEGADSKPYDAQLMDQIMGSDEHGSVLETGHLSAGLKAHGKQPLLHDDMQKGRKRVQKCKRYA